MLIGPYYGDQLILPERRFGSIFWSPREILRGAKNCPEIQKCICCSDNIDEETILGNVKMFLEL